MVYFVVLVIALLFQTVNSNACCRRKDDILHLQRDYEMFDKVERIPCDISHQDFQERFESKRKPVVLVGCDHGWKARDLWSAHNIASTVHNTSIWRALLLEDSDWNGKTPWNMILDARDKHELFYVFDNLDSPHGQKVANHYETPHMFKRDMFQNLTSFPPPDYGSMRWWAFGSPYSGTFPHSDPFQTDAWNTVVRGMKWWILFPSPADHEGISQSVDDSNLMELECNQECSSADHSILDYYTTILSNSKERYGIGKLKHIFIKSGETLYIPAGIPHSVLNLVETVAITANYASFHNWKSIWETMIEFSDDSNEHDRKNVYCNILDSSQRNLLNETMKCN
mmetsp:Transcript_2873/g.5392  ORF Transcript_2873/g.5392 Transcript_2873/m.5392 type:complete len:340 (+) Transcript_2873:1376-2395(+)